MCADAGAGGPGFSQIVEDFALANRCASCPHMNIYRKHAMCLEEYNNLLENYSMGKPTTARCARRG